MTASCSVIQGTDDMPVQGTDDTRVQGTDDPHINNLDKQTEQIELISWISKHLLVKTFWSPWAWKEDSIMFASHPHWHGQIFAILPKLTSEKNAGCIQLNRADA